VQQVIAALNAELENLRKLAEDTRQENLSFAGQMQQTRNAFQADATLSDEQHEPRLIKAAKEARVHSTVFAAAMQDTFSAKTDATNEEAVQAQIAAFRVARDLEGSRTLAARALDIRQATGSTDFMANIGFLQNVQTNSRVTSLAQVGQNLVPGIAGVMTRGDTPEQAAEFVATLNTLTQDAEGATTRTAAVSLTGQLRDFSPKRRADRERFAALQSTTARLHSPSTSSGAGLNEGSGPVRGRSCRLGAPFVLQIQDRERSAPLSRSL
jgi:hypothetical protein